MPSKQCHHGDVAPLVLLLALAVTAMTQPPPSRDATQLLDQFTRTTEFGRQLEVAEQLAATGDVRVLADLEPWLRHEDRHLRGNAAFVFAKLGDARGLETLSAILAHRGPRQLGQGIPGVSFNPSTYWWQERQLRADRYYAVHLLGKLQDPRTVDMLMPLLSDQEVGYKAAWALAEIGERRAIPALIGALASLDPMTRISAIDSLDRLKATDALPSLRALLGDTAMGTGGQRITVGEKARAAIASIGDSPLRIGDGATVLSDADVQEIVQISGCGRATPWLVIVSRVQMAERQYAEVFCAADAVSARVRRGASALVTRRIERGSVWGPWTVQGTYRYAQVLRTGDKFSDIAGLHDQNRPLHADGTLPDEELADLVTFLRGRAATPGAGPRERIEEWPVTRVTSNGDGTVTAVLSNGNFEAQRVVLRRTADRRAGWEIVSINYVVV